MSDEIIGDDNGIFTCADDERPEEPEHVCAECANPIDADSGSDLCGPCWRHWDAVDNRIDEECEQ